MYVYIYIHNSKQNATAPIMMGTIGILLLLGVFTGYGVGLEDGVSGMNSETVVVLKERLPEGLGVEVEVASTIQTLRWCLLQSSLEPWLYLPQISLENLPRALWAQDCMRKVYAGFPWVLRQSHTSSRMSRHSASNVQRGRQCFHHPW